MEGQCLGRGHGSHGQQTQGPLFEGNFVTMCMNKRPGCHIVLACYSSILKAHFILRQILLNHRYSSFSSFLIGLTEVSERKDEKITYTWRL